MSAQGPVRGGCAATPAWSGPEWGRAGVTWRVSPGAGGGGGGVCASTSGSRGARPPLHLPISMLVPASLPPTRGQVSRGTPPASSSSLAPSPQQPPRDPFARRRGTTAPPGVQGTAGVKAAGFPSCLSGVEALGVGGAAGAWPPGSSQLCSLGPPLSPPTSVCVAGACADLAFAILSPLSPPLPLSRLSSGKLQDLGVVEGSKLTLVPTVEAGLMVSGLFFCCSLLPSHSSPSIIKAPGEDVLAAPRLRCPALAEEAAPGTPRQRV